jgi:hypothetical protein
MKRTNKLSTEEARKRRNKKAIINRLRKQYAGWVQIRVWVPGCMKQVVIDAIHEIIHQYNVKLRSRDI